MIFEIKKPSGAENMSPKLVETLKKCKKGDVIQLEAGEYHIFQDGCHRDFFATTNNNSGEKSVAFPVIGKKDITVDGGGAEIIVHEGVYPFVIQNSENIKIRNIKLDTAHPLYGFGVIESIDEGGITLCMRSDGDCSSWRVNGNGNIVFFNGEREFSSGNIHITVAELDVSEMHDREDMWLSFFLVGKQRNEVENPPVSLMGFDARDLGNGRLRLDRQPDTKMRPYREGNGLLMMFRDRSTGCFFADSSKNTELSDVRIYRGQGMGLVAQNCENILIENMNISPKPERFGGISVTADCVHAVNCRGQISIRNSRFERSFDDPLNVHGIYTRAGEIRNGQSVKAELMHQDQRFVNVFGLGDEISFIDPETSFIVGSARVKKSEVSEDGRSVFVEFDRECSELAEGMLLENAEAMPEVLYTGNYLKNSSRLLCATPKRAEISGNIFDGMGNPIFITDCPDYWYESGRLGDMTIKKNVFRRSCYKGSRCPIIIRYENGRLLNKDRYLTVHKNVRVEENIIENSDFGIIEANFIDNLRVTGNRVRALKDSERLDKKQIPYEISNCSNVLIEGNTIEF